MNDVKLLTPVALKRVQSVWLRSAPAATLSEPERLAPGAETRRKDVSFTSSEQNVTSCGRIIKDVLQ